MNFGSGGNTKAKAWKDIWGSGQGVGAVKSVGTVEDMVARFEREYHAAKEELESKNGYKAWTSEVARQSASAIASSSLKSKPVPTGSLRLRMNRARSASSRLRKAACNSASL